MQINKNVISTAVSVQPMEINEHYVIINNGITELQDDLKGWEIAEQIIYDKDEYIKVISDKNTSLEEQTTDLQVALVEVYEMML